MPYEKLMMALVGVWQKHQSELKPSDFHSVYHTLSELYTRKGRPTRIDPQELVARLDMTEPEAISLLRLLWEDNVIRIFAQGHCPNTHEDYPVTEIHSLEDLKMEKYTEGCSHCGGSHELDEDDLKFYFHLENSFFESPKDKEETKSSLKKKHLTL